MPNRLRNLMGAPRGFRTDFGASQGTRTQRGGRGALRGTASSARTAVEGVTSRCATARRFAEHTAISNDRRIWPHLHGVHGVYRIRVGEGMSTLVSKVAPAARQRCVRHVHILRHYVAKHYDGNRTDD